MCYVCEEATASGGAEGFCLYNVCMIIVHLRLKWDYFPSKSTLCNPLPEVFRKPSSRIFLLLPLMALEGFHLLCLLKIYIEVNLWFDGMWLQALSGGAIFSLSSPCWGHPLSRWLALFPEPVSCIGPVTGMFYFLANISASEKSTELCGRILFSCLFVFKLST